MSSVGYATLQIIPSFKGFSGKLRTGVSAPLLGESDKAGKQAGERAGRSFSSVFAKFAIGATAALGAVHLGKGFVEAAIESQKVAKQTEAVFKSMGAQAGGQTVDGIGRLAEKLSLLSGVDDEVIQSASNVLLTFGKVRNEVGKGNDIFDRASTAALDMSVALKQDLQGATIQVGKALNDPLKGITALSRAGVSFTAQQKEQIKTLVESGKSLDAQKIILKELENQFGGSAKAQATAGDRLKVVFGNLQEQIGGYLLPVVEKVATFFAANLPRAFEAIGRVAGPVFKEIGGGFRALVESFKHFEDGTTSSGFALVMENVGITARRVFEFFKRNWPQIQQTVSRVFDAITEAGGKLVGFVTGKLLPGLVKVGQWVARNRPVLIGLAAAIGVGLTAAFVSWAAAAASAAAATIAATAPIIAIGAAIAALVAGVVWAYQNFEPFRSAVDAAGRAIRDKLWPALQTVASFIVSTVIPTIGGIASALGDFLAKVGEVVGGVIGFFGGLVEFFAGIPAQIGAVFGGLADLITAPFRAAFNGIADLWNNTVGSLSFTIPDWVPFLKGKSFNVPDIPTSKGLLSKVAARAAGGPVSAMRPYLVGEKGPELFVPRGSGSIVANHKMSPMSGGQGMSVGVELGLVPGAERGFMSALLGYLRVNKASARAIAKAAA